MNVLFTLFVRLFFFFCPEVVCACVCENSIIIIIIICIGLTIIIQFIAVHKFSYILPASILFLCHRFCHFYYFRVLARKRKCESLIDHQAINIQKGKYLSDTCQVQLSRSLSFVHARSLSSFYICVCVCLYNRCQKINGNGYFYVHIVWASGWEKGVARMNKTE